MAKAKISTLMCTCCGKEKKMSEYYLSYSRIYRAIEKIPVCKQCMLNIYEELYEETNDAKGSIYKLVRLTDMPYLDNIFITSLNSANSRGSNVWKSYAKNIKMPNYRDFTFDDGETLSESIEDNNIEEVQKEVKLTERDKQNENDVIRILGYDPFEKELLEDRKYLFNRLVDMLDDSTLEDNVRLMSVIEIIKGFNQIDKINTSIASMTADTSRMAENTSGIKSLIDTKKSLMTTILKTAEDNGLSLKFNTSKSKGSGTLTGTMKKLQEIGLEEAEVNLFDIQTAEGMKQVADMSHKSIMEQLMWDENDYTEMISFQKEELHKLNRDKDSLEEENRKLKIKIRELKDELNRNTL